MAFLRPYTSQLLSVLRFMSGARRPLIRTPASNFLRAACSSALSSQLSRFFSICVHCEITS